MELPAVVPAQRHRFYDGGEPAAADGSGARPPDPNADIVVVLDRKLQRDGSRTKELFLLRRRIAYDDRHCGEIIVPPRYESFESDLTSVPALFTWLVPKTGAHLPAALIHDGLVGDPGAPTYISSTGKVIDRVEADRIFRDGMADTGTPLVRRWLVWTAVTLATIWVREGTSSRRWVREYYRVIMVATIWSIAWLGYVATANLFAKQDRWWFCYDLGWMQQSAFGWRLVSGLAGAVAIPIVLGALWGTFRRAGWIAAIAMAVLFHITIGLLVVTGLYVLAEAVARRVPAAVLQFVAVAAVGVCVVWWLIAW